MLELKIFFRKTAKKFLQNYANIFEKVLAKLGENLENFPKKY